MQKTVLIVEDHYDIRQMTKYMVESFGYSVIEAKDGIEAIEEAREQHPDLILMDIAMPEMNGITAATMIRREDDFENIPIIAVTAYGKEYMEEAEAYGFDAVVEKPVYMDKMHNLLDHYLGGQ